MPRGLANPKHSVDFQSSVLDENDRQAVKDETKPERERDGTTTCAACQADSIGLCSIHGRDLTAVCRAEQRSVLETVPAEAAKGGGIPENFISSEGARD